MIGADDLVESIPDGLIAIRCGTPAADGRIVAVNGAFERMTGYVRSELVGRGRRMLDGARTDRAEFNRLMQAAALEQPAVSRVVQYGKNQDALEVEVQARPIDHEHVLLIYRPLRGGRTGATEAERTVEDRDARLRAIVEAAADGILSVDQHGIIESVNPSVRRIFGYDDHDLVGRNIRTLLPDLEVTGPPNGEVEIDGVHRDGHRIAVSVVVGSMHIRGRRMFIAIARDVTRRKRAEEQLTRYRQHLEELVETRTSELESSHEKLRMSERLASIGTLAAGLGHDMSNLLFPVHCHLDAISAVIRSPQARRDLHAIRESLEYLQNLSDGLRLLALDPSEESPGGASTDLATWWEEFTPLLAKALPSRAKLRARLPADLPRVGVAKHRLTQVVFNLVVNAAEAIQSDGTVGVVGRAHEDGKHVVLTVVDDGPGMTDEVRQRAMEPFFTTKRRGISTGLGLSLAHGIVESARGTFDIKSGDGRGTSIVMTFPACARVAPSVARPRAAVTMRDRRLAGTTVMLLESAGFEVCRLVEPGGRPPVRTVVWVLDAQSIDREETTRFLDADHRRRALVVGDVPKFSGSTRLVVLPRIGAVSNLREAVVRAASDLSEGSRNERATEDQDPVCR